MFKKITAFILVLAAFLIVQNKSCAFFFKKKTNFQTEKRNLSFVPVNEASGNIIWVGTFQLVWNDLEDEIVKAPVEFINYKSELAEKLNKKGFLSTDISENSYYKNHGYMTDKFKKEIEKSIEKKFNEKSDILNSLNWSPENYLLYAMLKKDFEYPTEFAILNNSDFTGEKVKYFGMRENAKQAQRNNVEVLFYNSKDDYAAKLITKTDDEVILYRTNDDKSLEEYFKDLNKKTEKYEGSKIFEEEDSLKVPFIKFDEIFSYNELRGKKIKGTDYVIDSAIQTAKFKLDNKGGSLKSEAAIATCKAMPIMSGRKFEFNKPFILFLIEKNKKVPYFITKFNNASLFEKP